VIWTGDYTRSRSASLQLSLTFFLYYRELPSAFKKIIFSFPRYLNMSLSSPSSSTVSLAVSISQCSLVEPMADNYTSLPQDSSSIRSSSASTDPSLFSSGLTTPADDCSQPFYNVAACSPTLGCKEDPAQCDEMATPKPLFLSKGFRQATRFAQNLVTPKVERITPSL